MMDNSQPRVISGRGEEIYSKLIKPLFQKSYQYDRVASFYSPKSLKILLNGLAQIWEKGGTIRLIIGFHERMEILPALEKNLEIKKAITTAVKKAMNGFAEEICSLLHNEDNIVPTIREMINQKGLYIRLVTPKVNLQYYEKNHRWPKPEIGTFHSKFIILHHIEESNRKQSIGNHILNTFHRFFYRPSSIKTVKENFSVITGSMNESLLGYTENIEDAILHRSWIKSEREVCEYFLDRFERIWTGEDKDVITMPFTEEFNEIINTINSLFEQKNFTWRDFSSLLQKSPLYCGLNLPNIGLLPHQISVYKDALSRWPIRVLLADEVGLGKTIEAGSILYYMKKFCNVKRVLILTPASLRRQWQNELKIFFNMDFWVYNSTQNKCELENNEIIVSDDPLSKENNIDNLIISWHWARLKSNKNKILMAKDLDLIVVDEAHHARIKEEKNGILSKTHLYNLLKEKEISSPHLILITATPYQTNILDFYSLLDILGVPNDFRDSLDRFAGLASGDLIRDLNMNVTLLKEIHSFIQKYNKKSKFEIIKNLEKMELNSNTMEYLSLLRENNSELKNDVYISNHPASFLTTRNYRSSLSEFGYDFPKANYICPKIVINEQQLELFNDIEKYIQTKLGLPEKILNDNNKIGLLRSLYRQRIVSSFQAAFDTITNRKEKLKHLIENHKSAIEFENYSDEFNSDSNDESDALPYLKPFPRNELSRKAYYQLALTEYYSIQNLLNRVENIFIGKKIKDPKITKLKELLDNYLNYDYKIIVFSRFTSTTEAIVRNLESYYNLHGVGRFDGKIVGIYKLNKTDIEIESRTRQEIVEDMKEGRIKILVCSDAASEGLNLHYANVVINMDVPWNPSRLQQRFGRVDRLGQKAKEVFLINMFYPNSIEEKMYNILENRRIGFRTVLGEVPEIMSNQQKEIINDLAEGNEPKINITLADVEFERSKSLRRKLDKIQTTYSSSKHNNSLYLDLINILYNSLMKRKIKVKNLDDKTIQIENKIISMNPLNENFISLGNPIFEKYEVKHKLNINKMKIFQIIDELENPLFPALIDEDEVFPITSKEWPLLFSYFFNDEPININKLLCFSKKNMADLLIYMKENEEWIWPNHDQITCLTKIKPNKFSINNISIGKELGSIAIRTD